MSTVLCFRYLFTVSQPIRLSQPILPTAPPDTTHPTTAQPATLPHEARTGDPFCLLFVTACLATRVCARTGTTTNNLGGVCGDVCVRAWFRLNMCSCGGKTANMAKLALGTKISRR